MSLILAALLAATPQQQDKASETCPATAFTFRVPGEATSKPKLQAKPKPQAEPDPKTARAQTEEPTAKADDCLKPTPKVTKSI